MPTSRQPTLIWCVNFSCIYLICTKTLVTRHIYPWFINVLFFSLYPWQNPAKSYSYSFYKYSVWEGNVSSMARWKLCKKQFIEKIAFRECWLMLYERAFMRKRIFAVTTCYLPLVPNHAICWYETWR